MSENQFRTIFENASKVVKNIPMFAELDREEMNMLSFLTALEIAKESEN